jgi:hypothetical protein
LNSLRRWPGWGEVALWAVVWGVVAVVIASVLW